MPDPPTLEQLLVMLQPRQPYAIARNEEFVQRSKYQQCRLMDEDRIEIVHPSAGGWTMQDTLNLYGQSFSSRILRGKARDESQAPGGQSFWEILRTTNRPILPNTAGCYTVKEALNTALMAREVFETDFLILLVYASGR